MEMKRGKHVNRFLIPLVLWIVCAVLILIFRVPVYAFNDNSMDSVPVPVEFPGEAEKAYYQLLCELISEYGYARDELWNQSKGYPGVEWATLTDLSGDGIPEFAVVISTDPGEDFWSNRYELDIYTYSSGSAELLDWFEISSPYNLKVAQYEGVPSIFTERVFYHDNSTYTTELHHIYVEEDEVISTPCKEGSYSPFVSSHLYDGFIGIYGTFLYIDHDLYQTITMLTGIEPALLNRQNKEWDSLYLHFLSNDSSECELSRYKLCDITGDGIPELTGSAIGNSSPIDNHSNCCVVSYCGSHIQFLIVSGFQIVFRNRQVAVNMHSLGHYDGDLIYSIQDNVISLEKSIECYFTASFQGIFNYLVDSVEVSEETYYNAVDTYDLRDVFNDADADGVMHKSSWKSTEDGMTHDDMAEELRSLGRTQYNNLQPSTSEKAVYKPQYMAIPESFLGDEEEHFFEVLSDRISQFGLCIRDSDHEIYGSGVLWSKMFDISGNDDKEFALIYTSEDESGTRHYYLEIYDNYSSEAGIVFDNEIDGMEWPSIGECDGMPCMRVRLPDGTIQHLTMQSGEIIDLGSDIAFSDTSQPAQLTGYYNSYGTYVVLDSDLYNTFAEVTGIDPSSVWSENSGIITGIIASYTTEITAGNTGYQDDPDLGLIAGEQVQGTEACNTMESAYAYALKLLVDQYGLCRYKSLTDRFWKKGIYSATLTGTNSGGSPYLIVGREIYDSPGALTGSSYLFSWENGKLIFYGVPSGAISWLSSIDGVPAIISGEAGSDTYGAYMLDGSRKVQWYGCYSPEYTWGKQENGELTYYVGDRIGSIEEFDEAIKSPDHTNSNLMILKGIAIPEAGIQFVSASVLDTYNALTEGESLVPVNSESVTWEILYQRMIEIYGHTPSARFQLLYLDEDDIPELIIQDYSTGEMIVMTSDGNSVETICSVSNAYDTPDISVMRTQDRCGTFLLGSDINDNESSINDTLMLISVKNGVFAIDVTGSHNQRYHDDEETWSDVYYWNGTITEDLNEYISMMEASLPKGAVSFFPKEEADDVLSVLMHFEPGRTLSVTDGWNQEEAEMFREECGVYDEVEDYVSDDDYEEDYDSEDNYEEDYDSDDYETAYTGPADLADASADWNAVNEAGLTSGDPVTVPGDYYTDGQERYKETGYILPQSATRYLTEEDIAHLTMKGCCYARNEIYARHGRMFNANELQNYFNSCSWYEGTVSPESFDESYTQSVLNEYEYENAYFLLKYEEEHGMYWPE